MPRRHGNVFYGALAGIGLFAAAATAVKMSRRISFKDKVVFITGGSRGLGLVLAREFAEEGAHVAICARSLEELNRAVDDIAERGGNVVAVTCDVTSQEEVSRAVADVVKRFGGIDVLINNAGTIAVGPVEMMTVADYEEAMKTHFYGPLYATLAVLPHLRQRRGGRIVNVSSIGGKVAVPHLLPYSASKFALTGFSEGLRAELLKDEIYVTTVCPGLMRTGSPRNAWFKGKHREEYAWFHVSDAIPCSSMAAIRAARQIIRACRYGRAEIVLSMQAKAAATMYSLMPGVSSEVLGCVNTYLLPSPGGIGEMRARGSESESAVTRSWITGLSRKAEAANNER